jgi:signal transduction histidine kinase
VAENMVNTIKKSISKTTTRVLIILIIGTCIIQGALVMCIGQYLRKQQVMTPSNTAARTHDIYRTIQLIDLSNYNTINKNLHLFQIKSLHTVVANSHDDNAYIIDKPDIDDITDYIKENFNNINISINKGSNKWVNITIASKQPQPLIWGYPLVASALCIALLLLYLWSANRLSIPFEEFLRASKQFGVDLNAPPMALQGSREMKEAITAFNQMQSRIKRLVSDRTQMLAAISHDLRTPITRLQLRAEYISDEKQYNKSLDDLKEMETMISSILSFSRDYASTEPIELFDMNALLATMCDDFTDTGKPATYNCHDKRITIKARLIPIKRALTNLIENAIKYGESANISLIPQDESLQIKIEDAGPGIAEHQMDKVFDPFYRIDPARSPEISGSGLGMAVARDIIRAHGGDIKLHNSQPKGLTVLITLPK